MRPGEFIKLIIGLLRGGGTVCRVEKALRLSSHNQHGLHRDQP